MARIVSQTRESSPGTLKQGVSQSKTHPYAMVKSHTTPLWNVNHPLIQGTRTPRLITYSHLSYQIASHVLGCRVHPLPPVVSGIHCGFRRYPLWMSRDYYY